MPNNLVKWRKRFYLHLFALSISSAFVSNLFNGCKTLKKSLIIDNVIISSGTERQSYWISNDKRFMRSANIRVSNTDDSDGSSSYGDINYNSKDNVGSSNNDSSSSSSSSNYDSSNKGTDARNSIYMSRNDNNDQILRSNEPSNSIHLINQVISGQSYLSSIEIDNIFFEELMIMRGRDIAEAMYLSGIY